MKLDKFLHIHRKTIEKFWLPFSQFADKDTAIEFESLQYYHAIGECKNCQYWGLQDENYMAECEHWDSPFDFDELFEKPRFHQSFGCNHWEKSNDQ